MDSVKFFDIAENHIGELQLILFPYLLSYWTAFILAFAWHR